MKADGLAVVAERSDTDPHAAPDGAGVIDIEAPVTDDPLARQAVELTIC